MENSKNKILQKRWNYFNTCRKLSVVTTFFVVQFKISYITQLKTWDNIVLKFVFTSITRTEIISQNYSYKVFVDCLLWEKDGLNHRLFFTTKIFKETERYLKSYWEIELSLIFFKTQFFQNSSVNNKINVWFRGKWSFLISQISLLKVWALISSLKDFGQKFPSIKIYLLLESFSQ